MNAKKINVSYKQNWKTVIHQETTVRIQILETNYID